MYFVSSPVEVFLTNSTNDENPSHMIFASREDNNSEYTRFVQNKIFNGNDQNGIVVHANWALDQFIYDLTEDEGDKCSNLQAIRQEWERITPGSKRESTIGGMPRSASLHWETG